MSARAAQGDGRRRLASTQLRLLLLRRDTGTGAAVFVHGGGRDVVVHEVHVRRDRLADPVTTAALRGEAAEKSSSSAWPRGGMGRRASLVKNSMREKLSRRSATDRPEITGISPDAGSLSGGTKVNIQGRNLGSSAADVVSVIVAGVECAPSQVAWISPALIKVKTSAGAGKGPVVVGLRGGQSCTSPTEFSYVSGESNGDGDAPQENGALADDSAAPLTGDERSRLLTSRGLKRVKGAQRRGLRANGEGTAMTARRAVSRMRTRTCGATSTKIVAVLSGDLSLLVR